MFARTSTLIAFTALFLFAPKAEAQVGTVFCTCFDGTADACAIPDPTAGCQNSTGVGASLTALGSANVAADDLQLVVSNIPPNKFGLVFMGGGQTQVPFGSGLRCVSPGPRNISRFLAKQADSNGTFVEGPGIVAFAQANFQPISYIVAGCTYQFQGWYRDPLDACGTSFNLTNGLQVTFNAGNDLTTVRGRVFYDYNLNGVLDDIPEEEPLEGWKVVLESECGVSETFSDADGFYEVLRDRNGLDHVVTSIAPAPGYIGDVNGRWLATLGNPVNIVTDTPEVVVNFGAVYFSNVDGPTLATGIGFWHNAGEELLLACDPEWRGVLNDLCLRTNQTQADPLLHEETIFLISETGSFEQEFQRLSDYLVGPSNGVLANILSVQFAAANLNVACGPLEDVPTFVDQLGDGVLVSLEDMIANTRELLCMPCAANTGPGGDEACRELIMNCLVEWEGLNSDGGRTYTPSRDPAEYFFASPY